MKKHKDLKFFIQCECRSQEHIISVMQFNGDHVADDNKLGQCIVSTSMNHYMPWYKRLWTATKFVFGGTDIHYTETIVDVRKLKKIVSELKDERPEADDLDAVIDTETVIL